MRPSRITMIESPYTTPKASRQECIRYALWACADATHDHQEAVIATHLYYTQFLPEDPMTWAWGLACRDLIAKACGAQVALYEDLGTTGGMVRDVDCTAVVVHRKLGDWARGQYLQGLWPEGTIRPLAVG
jgi:hypothetical protein